MISNIQAYLHQIKERSLIELVQSQNFQILFQLLQLYDEEGCKANKINFIDYDGFTALHKACGRGIREIVELLLENGADPNVVNNGGETAAHIAARRGNPIILSTLKHFNADLEKLDNKGQSIVHNAVMCDNVLILLWIERSTNISLRCKDFSGNNPFHLSCVLGKRNCIKFFLRKSRNDILEKTALKENCFHLLIKHRQLQCIPLILLNFSKNISLFSNENESTDKRSVMLSSKNSDNKTPIDLFNELPYEVTSKNNSFMFLLIIMNLASFKQVQLNFCFYRIFLFLFPFVSFLIGILLEIYTWPNYGIVIYPIVGIITLGFIRSQTHRTSVLDTRQNPIFAGAFLAGIIHDFLCFYVKIYPILTSRWELLLIAILLPILTMSYLRLIIVEPGKLQISEVETDDFVKFLSDELIKQKLNTIPNLPLQLDKFCQVCETAPKINRVKHCKLCDICVVNLDHHCLFLMKCIARNNIRNFIILIILSLFLIVLFLYVSLIAIIDKCGSLSGASPLPYVYCSYTKQTWISTGMLFNAVSFIWGIFMLYSQLLNISFHSTYYYQVKYNLKYTLSKRMYRVMYFMLHGRYYLSNEERKILANI